MNSPKSLHSRLPWRVSPTDDTVVIDADRNEVASIDGDYNQPETWPIMEANAAFIVKAANCHESLVAALRAMVANFEPFTAKPMGAPHSPARLEQEAQVAAYAKARAALALAEGGE